ncbi:hypothetical protein PM082_018299 [Marasmius tenuissimus]|nr:hypothetical protein PM082_018299 [Marasmius tenuissimus]
MFNPRVEVMLREIKLDHTYEFIEPRNEWAFKLTDPPDPLVEQVFSVPSCKCCHCMHLEISVFTRPSSQFEGITITIIISTVDVVLMLRVWILYRRWGRLLYWLLPLVGAEFLAMLVTDYFVVTGLKRHIHVGPILKGCYAADTIPKYYAFMSVPSLVVSSIMFAMTVYKCGGSVFSSTASRAPLISLFMRDGIFWFLAVFAVMVPQTLIGAGARPTLMEVMINLCLATYSIISSRVLLNIKQIMRETEVMVASSASRVRGEYTMEMQTLHFKSVCTTTERAASILPEAESTRTG